MSLIQFVSNYDDLSTDRGYQFKFYCDKCHNGFMTRFQPSVTGTAGSLLRAAGNIFGGWASSAGNAAYDIQRSVGGPAHDNALQEAVREGKEHFHQCTRCGQWVCPEVCWNAKANLCEGCAPDYQEEMAAAHANAKAEATREQLYEKARGTDYVSGVDMKVDSYVSAPTPPASQTQQAAPAFCGSCGASVGRAKFCPECGVPTKPPKLKCGGCGNEPEGTPKFCPECGMKLPLIS